MSFKSYLKEQEIALEQSSIEFTKEEWEFIITCESEEQFDTLCEASLGTAFYHGVDVLKSVWRKLREEISELVKMTNLTIIELRIAFLSTEIRDILRFFGYSLKRAVALIFRSIGIVGNVMQEVFERLDELGFGDDISRGLDRIDQILNDIPSAKKVSGVMVAAVLVYIWLSMTFTGRFSSDMNLKTVLMALAGKYSLRDVFGTAEGKMMLTLFGTGAFITFPWLGITAGNLLLALVYTGFILNKEHKLASKLVSKIKTGQRFSSLE